MGTQDSDSTQRQLDALAERVARLEHRMAPPPYWTAAPADAAAAAATRPAPGRKPAVELTPSRVLALAGGAVLLLGIGFLVRYALVQGWLGPQVRIALGAASSLAIATVGVRLEQRAATRGVGQVCSATGAAGLYTTIVAATAGYALLPGLLGALAAAAVGGVVLGRGVWAKNQWVAALGVGASLAAPVVVGAAHSTGTLALLVVMLAVAVVVTVHRSWPLLALLAFVVVSPQLWVVAASTTQTGAVLGLVGVCGGLLLAAAVAAGTPASSPRFAPPLLTALNALSVALTGAWVLNAHGTPAADAWWVAGVAVANLAAAVVATARPGQKAVAATAAACGVLLADAAAFLAFDGHAAAGALLAITVLATAAGAARPLLLLRAARAAVVAQLVVMGVWGTGVYVAAPAAGSAEAVLTIGGICTAAVAVALQTRALGRGLALAAGATLLAVAVVRALTVEATVWSLLEGTDHLAAALAICAAITASAGVLGWLLHRRFTAAAVVTANYAVSLAAVAMDPDGAGRVALTGLWALGGAAALTAGRRLQRNDLRRGGAALLTAAVAKAAVVDTVLLDGTNRAVALLLCGTVLVATAVAEARSVAERAAASDAG